jgi:hypothetical protein
MYFQNLVCIALLAIFIVQLGNFSGVGLWGMWGHCVIYKLESEAVLEDEATTFVDLPQERFRP